MAKPASDSRYRVYRALVDQHNLTTAASLLKMARSTVRHHADLLVADHVLRKVEKRQGKPAEYRRGSRALLFEANHLEAKNPRKVRAASVPDGSRVHRGEFKVRVQPFAHHKRALPEDADSWGTPSGTVFTEWWHTTSEGHQVRVRECRGAKNCTLILQPEEEVAAGPVEVASIERTWARRVDAALSELETVYGYVRAGGINRSTPVEYEWKAPALAKGARAQAADGDVWTDASKGPVSLETDSQTVAVAVAGLPEHLVQDREDKADLRARLDALLRQGNLLQDHECVDLGVLESIVSVQELHGAVMARHLGVQQ